MHVYPYVFIILFFRTLVSKGNNQSMDFGDDFLLQVRLHEKYYQSKTLYRELRKGSHNPILHQVLCQENKSGTKQIICIYSEMSFIKLHEIKVNYLWKFSCMRNMKNVPLWSSGQSFWLQIQRSRFRFPALPDFLRSSGSGTGPTQPREDN
jgi:hypothetical protein